MGVLFEGIQYPLPIFRLEKKGHPRDTPETRAHPHSPKGHDASKTSVACRDLDLQIKVNPAGWDCSES